MVKKMWAIIKEKNLFVGILLILFALSCKCRADLLDIS